MVCTGLSAGKINQMQSLPIDAVIPDIIAHLRSARSLVLTAQPGAGKTTRIAPAIVKSNLLTADNFKVLLLQPRRVATRAVAQRIAQENNWPLGEQVGYIVRLERRCGPTTQLTVMTEGVLNRQLLADPFLPGVGAVVLDEFHERSVHSDLALALLKQIQQTIRPDLLIVVMSATLDVEPVAAYLGNCPAIHAPGRTFPVDITHAVDAKLPLELQVAQQVRQTYIAGTAGQPGGILVFLPGAGEIDRCRRALADWAAAAGIPLLPLHGSLPLAAQIKAIAPGKHARVILATNIAETSLTIDGITTVIDSGLVRRAGYDAARGMDSLELVRISKASAQQRAGRAGRTSPGQCVRLWSLQEDRFLAPFDPPEVARIDMAPTVLELFWWDAKGPSDFDWLTPPPAHAIDAAIELLVMLGALQRTGPTSSPADIALSLTALGKTIASLPLHPRLACMLHQGNRMGLARPAALLAAMLGERDFAPIGTFTPTGHEDSDVLIRFEWLEQALQGQRHNRFTNGDNPSIVRIARTAEQLVSLLGKSAAPDASIGPTKREALLRLLLAAFPDRVCRRRANDPKRAAMIGGRGVVLGPQSGVLRPEFFIAVDVTFDPNKPRGEGVVRMASAIQPEWLTDSAVYQERQLATWDQTSQRVVGLRQICYGELVMREAPGEASPEQSGRLMEKHFQGQLREIVLANPSAGHLLQRLDYATTALPQLKLPIFDEAFLQELAAPLWPQVRSRRDLESFDWHSTLWHALSLLQQRMVATDLPESLQLPSGHRATITYNGSGAPVLAAKLQEFFGLKETPRIGDGRIPLLLHLLGPNGRPVQVTSDLKSFWQTGYFMVRKDLKARYPRHYWPDEPATAAAVVSARKAREQANPTARKK
ncbi:MAG: ATP-dependent helicase HrpB [Phycisphaerales bacterium]|nr:ATP-dependent helicase HrpB [Phycisphaerales bacterium]